MKAIWQNTVIAESSDTVVVEGNHYFPLASIKREYFEANDTRSTCPWKGVAHYFTVNVNGTKNTDAAFWYPEPKNGAEQITDRVAFWKGIEVTP